MKFVGTAPTRVDLAGGTLDLWPIHHMLGRGCTVNFGVTVSARIEISFSKDKNFHLESSDQKISISGSYSKIQDDTSLPLVTHFLRYLWSDKFEPLSIRLSAKSPAGAGLGGSSCLAVTLAGLLSHLRSKCGYGEAMNDHELVEASRDIEARLIQIPTGVQDYWGALRGGANVITFGPGRPTVETLRTSVPSQLTDDLVLVFSGKSRASAGNNWQIFKAFVDGDKKICKAFGEIADLALVCGDALKQNNFGRLMEASQEEWSLRKTLWPDIETIETLKIAKTTRDAGSYFSRICGAGGGGVMAVFAHPDARKAVVEAAEKAGGTVLPAEFSKVGLKIEELL